MSDKIDFGFELIIMPAKDIVHEQVKKALVKDGWKITADPLKIKYGKKNYFVDLGAEKMLAAEKDGRKIAVEIKSFVGRSDALDLEQALGQFTLYYDLLAETAPERVLYLAVSTLTYQAVFQEATGQLLLRNKRLRLLVFDADREEIRQWIN